MANRRFALAECSTELEISFDSVLDLMLPQINGLDICRLLRHQGNPVPILILSAKAVKTVSWAGSGSRRLPHQTLQHAGWLSRLLPPTLQQFAPEVLQFKDIALYPQE